MTRVGRFSACLNRRLKEHNLFDVDAGHFARQFKDQVVPLAMQLIEFANVVVFTGENLLAVSSVQGLQVYRLAQHAVKQPDGADLQPFVDTMSHIVKKTSVRNAGYAVAGPRTSLASASSRLNQSRSSLVSSSSRSSSTMCERFDAPR